MPIPPFSNAPGASTSVSNNWTAQQNFSNPIQIGTPQSQGGQGAASSIQAWGTITNPSSGAMQNLLSRIQFTPSSDTTTTAYGIYSQIFNEASIAYGNLNGSGITSISGVATNRGSGPIFNITGFSTHIGNQTDAFNSLPVVNCSITSGSQTVTPSSMTGLYVGQGVTGAFGSGIPANTFITSVGVSTITISNQATATNSSVALTFSGGINSLYGYYCDNIVTSGIYAPVKYSYGLYLAPQVPSLSATINNTTTVTVASTLGIASGMPITGAGIPRNTTVSSITNSTQFVISNSATTSGSTTIYIQGYTIANPYAIYQSGTSDQNYFAGYTTFAGVNSFSTPALFGSGSVSSPSVNLGTNNVQSGLYSSNGTTIDVSVSGTQSAEFTNGANGANYFNCYGTSSFSGQLYVNNQYLTIQPSSGSASLNLFSKAVGSSKQWYIQHDSSTSGCQFQYYNGSAFINPLLITSSGNTVTNQIGNTFGVKSGSNAKAGTFTLSSGTVTVSNTSVTANSVIILTVKTVSGTRGSNPDIVPNAGTGFTATASVTDNSTYNYIILEVN